MQRWLTRARSAAPRNGLPLGRLRDGRFLPRLPAATVRWRRTFSQQWPELKNGAAAQRGLPPTASAPAPYSIKSSKRTQEVGQHDTPHQTPDPPLRLPQLRRVLSRKRSSAFASKLQHDVRAHNVRFQKFWHLGVRDLKSHDVRDARLENRPISKPILQPDADAWLAALINLNGGEHGQASSAAVLNFYRTIEPRSIGFPMFVGQVVMAALKKGDVREIENIIRRVRRLVPPYAVVDVLRYNIDLLRIPVTRRSTDDLDLIKRVMVLIADLSEQHMLPHKQVPQPELRMLLDALDVSDVAPMLHTWIERGVDIHGNTKLHIVKRLGENGCVDDAIKLLRDVLKHSSLHVETETLRSATVTVLRGLSTSQHQAEQSLDIMSDLVDAGIPLNIHISNVVMLTAVERRDVTTAFKVYEMLRQFELQPDEYTFSILTKACRIDIRKSELLIRLIREAIADKVLLQDVFLGTDVLDCLYKQHIKHKRKNAFELLLAAFQTLFNAKPLVDLGLVAGDRIDKHRVGPMQAPDSALRIMIRAFVFCNGKGSEEQIASERWALYERLRSRAKAGDLLCLELFRGDYLANTFVQFFGQRFSSLPMAIKVVENMSLDNQEFAGSRQDQDVQIDTPPTQQSFCGPTTMTLSLVHHFLCMTTGPEGGFLSQAEIIYADLLLRKPLDDQYSTHVTMLRGYLNNFLPERARMLLERELEDGVALTKNQQWIQQAIEDQCRRHAALLLPGEDQPGPSAIKDKPEGIVDRLAVIREQDEGLELEAVLDGDQ